MVRPPLKPELEPDRGAAGVRGLARSRRFWTRPGRRPGAAVSFALHLAILLFLLWPRPDPPTPAQPVAITVSLIEAPPVPKPSPKPPSPKRPGPKAHVPKVKPAPPKPPSHAKQAQPRNRFRRSPAPAAKDSLPMAAAEPGPELTAAELAGAASADGGGGGGEGGGGACDMAGRVQAALRKDPLVRAAVAATAGKATRVWDGDWVKSKGEDGKGLAAVREAIMWEVAFAPEACRKRPQRGLILLSLNTASGPARLAVGGGDWRWADLLTPRASVSR